MTKGKHTWWLSQPLAHNFLWLSTKNSTKWSLPISQFNCKKKISLSHEWTFLFLYFTLMERKCGKGGKVKLKVFDWFCVRNFLIDGRNWILFIMHLKSCFIVVWCNSIQKILMGVIKNFLHVFKWGLKMWEN